MQGRLTRSPNNTLQYFPKDNWQEEFAVASSLGFQYIEFFVERTHNEKNPIWSKQGLAEIRSLSQKYDLELYSICNDYVIEHSLTDHNEAVEQTKILIAQAASVGISKLVLPLFEKSEITEGNFHIFREPLVEIADAAKDHGLLVCLETLLDGGSLLKLIKNLNKANVVVCFDTGNRVALGQDIYSDILLLNNCIRHVHIKDKDLRGNNVFLGTGDVNFHMMMQSLFSIGYDGAFTLETFRGRDPIQTAKYHKLFLEFFIRELSADQN